MVNMRVFYTGKDWFGNVQHYLEAKQSVSDEAEMKAALNKCFSGFGNTMDFAFRIEADDLSGEFYLVEQDYSERESGVYSVTHRINNLHLDLPVKMSRAAIRKLALKMLNDSQNSDVA